MIHLHYNPSNASMTPHMVLRELGVPFELKFVDREHGALQSPEYLKLNPNGLIPVLVDGDPSFDKLRTIGNQGSGQSLVLYETAAIVLYLIEKYPAAALAPPVNTPERAIFYKWLMWLACTVQPMVPHYFYSHRMAAPGNTVGAAEVKAQAEAKLGIYYDRIDAQLASHGGPWFAGEHFSALDPYAFMLCRWSRGMQRPARTLPHIGPYLSRMLERPAVRKVFEVEELKAPFF
jgi:glutathione S-transferase